MGKLKFCANISWLYKERPFLERYEAAASSGFTAVECGWPYEHSIGDLVQARTNAGIEHILLNSGSAKNLGNAANFEDPQKFKDELDLAIQYANALQCKHIHIMAGNVSDKASNKKALATFVENLKYAGDRLQSHQITGLIEPLNKRSAPNYTLSTSLQALEILGLVNKPNILYQLDFFHLQIMEGNLTHSLKDNMRSIGHIQVSQVPDRSEPSSSGEIDFKYIFNLLEELGYEGWIGCEYMPSTSTEESLKWFKAYLSK